MFFKVAHDLNVLSHVCVEFVVFLFFDLASKTEISSSFVVAKRFAMFAPSFLPHNSHNFAYENTYANENNKTYRGAFINLNCYCNKNKTRYSKVKQ